MARRSLATLALLAACHHRPPRDVPIGGTPHVPPAPAGFATCDFVTLEAAGTLTAWKLGTDGAAQRLGSIALAAPEAEPMHGDWADREHLFVRIAPGVAALITRDGVTQLTAPDLRALVAKPEDDARATPGSADLVIARGEVWWAQCPWTVGPDGGSCAGWISQRLWPGSPTTVRALVEEREDPWVEQAPEGYRVERATCTAPGSAPVVLAPAVASTHWLSAHAPRLLVILDEVRWALRDGCGAVLAEGDHPRPGVDGTWTGIEGDALVLRRGDTVLARVPLVQANTRQLLVRP